MKKGMNNKGFSLVELIVVIAIMAVLVGVLAPQFLRYVERSRLQKDNQAIGEIANAAKSALAQENVNDEVGVTTITYSYSTSIPGFDITAPTGATSVNLFKSEMTSTVGTQVKINSKSYKSPSNVRIEINNSASGVSVNAVNYIENAGSTPIASKGL